MKNQFPNLWDWELECKIQLHFFFIIEHEEKKLDPNSWEWEVATMFKKREKNIFIYIFLFS